MEVIYTGHSEVECEGSCPYEPLNINGGTLADGTTYTFNTPSTLIDLGQGTIEHGSSEDLIVTFSGPVDLQFTNAVAPSTRGVWHGNGSGSLKSRATTNGSTWCYNPGSDPADIEVIGQVAQAITGASSKDANDDWGTLETYGATEVSMFAYVFDAYNYEARPSSSSTKCLQPVCDVLDDVQNKLKVALTPDVVEPEEVTEVTRAELLARKNAGELTKGMVYTITNASVPTVLAGALVAVEATDVDQIEGEARLIHPETDCTNWEVHYDLNTNRMERIHNHVLNVEIEGTSVLSFDWTATTVQNLEVLRNSRIDYTAGTINGLSIQNGSRAIVRSGTITNVSVSDGSNLDMSTGSIIDTTIDSDGYLRMNGTGRIRYNEVSTGADVYYDAWTGTADRNSFTNNARAYFTGSGGTASDNSVNRAYLYARNSAALNVVGNSLDSLGYLWVENNTTAAVSYNNISSRAYLNISGQSGTFQYNSADSYATLNGTLSSATVRYNSFSNSSSITYNNATDFQLQRNEFSRGYINARNSTIRVLDNEVNSYALMYLWDNPNNALIQYNQMSSISRLYGYTNFQGTFDRNQMSGDSFVYVFQVTGAAVIRRNLYAANALVRYTQGAGTSNQNVYSGAGVGTITIAVPTSNDIQGY